MRAAKKEERERERGREGGREGGLRLQIFFVSIQKLEICKDTYHYACFHHVEKRRKYRHVSSDYRKYAESGVL